jgi:hypothetical protein
MHKIASPQDLQAELRRLLAYSQEVQPSRQVLASELRELANRVAGWGKKETITAKDLEKPLDKKAIVVLDAYPAMDDHNLTLEKGEVPLDVIKKWMGSYLKDDLEFTSISSGKPTVARFKVKGYEAHGEPFNLDVTLAKSNSKKD